MMSSLPSIILGPFGGAIADHYPRKLIIIFSDLFVGTLTLVMALAFFLKPGKIELIVILMFTTTMFFGAINSVFRPAVFAIIPNIVDKKKISKAIGIVQNILMFSMMAGQTLGGLLFTLIGISVLVVLNSIAFILSAISECFIRITTQSSHASVKPSRILQDTKEGFIYIRKQRGLLILFLILSLSNFFFYPSVVLLPFLVDNHLGVTMEWFGYLMASMALGVGVGNLSPGFIKIPREKTVKLLAIYYFALSASLILISHSTSPIEGLLLLFISGFLLGACGVIVFTTVQLTTPEYIRGRVFGMMITLTHALPLISIGFSGVLADYLDKKVSPLYWINGVCILISVIPLLLFSKSAALKINSSSAE